VNDWLERNDRWIARVYTAVQVALLVVATGFFGAVVLGLSQSAAG